MTAENTQHDLFRDTVRQRAAEKQWPEVTYEAAHYTNAESTRIVTSGLLTSTDPAAGLAITVGPGEERWNDFFKRAIYYDVSIANGKLLKLG